jgi:LPS export ABC transporter protein LptC
MRTPRVAVLAGVLGCSGFAACNEGGLKPPPGVVSATDSADQVLYGFVHFLTRDGVREGQVEADTAYFYDPTQTTLLRNMKLVFIDSAGNENATITSKVGTYKWQTGDMTADSNVVLRSHDGRLLKTEHLLYDAAKKELSTKVPFTFDRKGEHLSGNGFVSDIKFQHIVVDSPQGVRKVLDAQGAEKVDSGAIMPGQGDSQ